MSSVNKPVKCRQKAWKLPLAHPLFFKPINMATIITMENERTGVKEKEAEISTKKSSSFLTLL